MEASRFCTHCGKAIPPNMRFCTACGAEWVALPGSPPAPHPDDLPQQAASPPGAPQLEYAQPAPVSTKKPFFSGWRLYVSIGVGILVGLMVLGAIVGEDEKKADSTSATSSQAGPTQQAPTEAPRTTAQPTAAAPRATTVPAAAARPLDIKAITPVALNLPPIRGEVLGSANPLAADQVRQAVGTVIQDLRGVDVSVHRWLGKPNSVLVIDIDEAASRRFPTDANPVLKAISTSPAIAKSNITDIVLVSAGRDERGTYTFTARMSFATATALASGSLSEQQIRTQVVASMTRP